MMDDPADKKILPVAGSIQRPFLVTLLCLFSFVFFGFIAILFIVALFYSGNITGIVNKYLPEHPVSTSGVFLYTCAGFLLHIFSVAGSAMIWRMKRKGYILFAISSLIITSYQLSQTQISFMTTSVYILLIILFGIFYKKMK